MGNVTVLACCICLISRSIASSPVLNESALREHVTPRPSTAGRRENIISIPTEAVSERIPDELFGNVRDFGDARTQTEQHPRLLFDQAGWDALLERYATNALIPGTFAHRWLAKTLFVSNTVALDFIDKDLDDAEINELVLGGISIQEFATQAFFMRAFRAYMNIKRHQLGMSCDSTNERTGRCLPYERALDQLSRSKRLLVNWARCLLASRRINGPAYGTPQTFSVTYSYSVGGIGYALAFDVLYNELSDEERLHVQHSFVSILDSITFWGDGQPASRIFSNWAAYNSHVYLMNAVLENKDGYNAELANKYEFILEAYSRNSYYPSGFSFEDGYTPSVSLREGSFGLIALARRGFNTFDSPRFRNFLAYYVQSSEPWTCPAFIGHGAGSGGGYMYQSVHALAVYVYPNGRLPQMMWHQNIGPDYNCYFKIQSALDLTIMGSSHADGSPERPEFLIAPHTGVKLSLSVYGRERGTVIGRSDLSDQALYVHFDARHDAMFGGHDNADRGTFTLTSHRKTWAPELPWRAFSTSDYHNLVRIDGSAQGPDKAPSVRMLHTPEDDGEHLFATADLTYATNFQWNRAWLKPVGEGWMPETSDPRDLGFPADYADSIELPHALYGNAEWAFGGLFWYRRALQTMKRNIRSTALVRAHNSGDFTHSASATTSYFIVADDLVAGDGRNHTYSWEMVLDKTVSLEYEYYTDEHIVLSSVKPGEENLRLSVHVLAFPDVPFSYKLMEIGNGAAVRLGITPTKNVEDLQFFVILHPWNTSVPSSFSLMLSVSRTDDFLPDSTGIHVRYGSTSRTYKFGNNEKANSECALRLCHHEYTALAVQSGNALWVPLVPFHQFSSAYISTPRKELTFLPKGSTRRAASTTSSVREPELLLDRNAIFDILRRDQTDIEYYEQLYYLVSDSAGQHNFSVCSKNEEGLTASLGLYTFPDEPGSGANLFDMYRRREVLKLAQVAELGPCQHADGKQGRLMTAFIDADVPYVLGVHAPVSDTTVSYEKSDTSNEF